MGLGSLEIILILIIVSGYGLFAFLIATFIGKKRKIGFLLSFLLSFFLGPIIGLIITLLSKKITNY